METMVPAVNPQGLMARNLDMSGATFSPNPWYVTQRLTEMPIEAIFPYGARVGSSGRANQTPVSPSFRVPTRPNLASIRIRASSIFRKKMQVTLRLSQGKNGVAHQLARPVIGHVATTLDFHHRDVTHGQQVFVLGSPAQGVDVGVFDQHHGVWAFVRFTRLDERFLGFSGRRVGPGAPVQDPGWVGWTGRT